MKLNFVLWGLVVQTASAFSTSRTGLQREGRIQLLASTLAATVDIREGVQRNVNSMEEWAAQCGVQTADGFQLIS
jgi:hypothetical protein